MPTTTFLQLGDIHYPKYSQQTFLDDKMSSASKIASGLSGSLFATAMSLIEKLSREYKIAFAAMVGDFTDGGNRPGFLDSISFFSQAFKSLGIKAIGVPGNHDLDWPEVLTKDFNKFKHFEEMLNTCGDGLDLSFKMVERHKGLGGEVTPISVYALNSCLGCYDIWKMSTLYKIEFDIEEHLGAFDAQTLYSRFDAPYLDRDTLLEVCNEIGADYDSVPIILTHHNLFPQRIPRIAIFPEMLNAGYVRDQLKRLNRPIIYLHGHVHDSLIESLLADQDEYQLSIVAVSAPLFADGFNLVDLFCTNDGVPLGIQINEFRHDKVAYDTLRRRRVRFYSKDKGSILLDDKAQDLLAEIGNRQKVAWQPLADKHSEEKLLELEFMGEISIIRPVHFKKATWRVGKA